MQSFKNAFYYTLACANFQRTFMNHPSHRPQRHRKMYDDNQEEFIGIRIRIASKHTDGFFVYIIQNLYIYEKLCIHTYNQTKEIKTVGSIIKILGVLFSTFRVHTTTTTRGERKLPPIIQKEKKYKQNFISKHIEWTHTTGNNKRKYSYI